MAFSRTTAFEYLRRAHEQNRLAHAYLITGPPGSGKETLAAHLASLVNGTPVTDVFSFPLPGRSRNRGGLSSNKSASSSMHCKCAL
ncbi:MAG: hypothetical protein DMF22_09895 [Verrucomicrobia bacterium]|nr:MAG: hypothetical protein DMF22_09895 [Verrucomicrobiota bacterium]